MIGPRELARSIAGVLEAHLVAEVDRLAIELGPVVPTDGDQAGEGDAGDGDAGGDAPLLDARPALIASTQLSALDVGIDDWPFVLVVAQDLQSLRRADVTADGASVYVSRSSVRLFVWARGDGYEFTAAVRDRLTLAVRETLLRRQHLDTAEHSLELDEGTLRESYSDVAVDETLNATVAAAVIDVVVVASSQLTPLAPILGQVDTLLLDTQTEFPPHPAL